MPFPFPVSLYDLQAAFLLRGLFSSRTSLVRFLRSSIKNRYQRIQWGGFCPLNAVGSWHFPVRKAHLVHSYSLVPFPSFKGSSRGTCWFCTLTSPCSDPLPVHSFFTLRCLDLLLRTHEPFTCLRLFSVAELLLSLLSFFYLTSLPFAVLSFFTLQK